MNFNKILIRGPDTIGSFVLATPFYRELRKNFPYSYIVLCVKPLVYELSKNCKYVNNVLLYSCKSLKERLLFLKLLKKEKFESVFLLSGSFESALMSYLSGIKIRIGYPHDRRGFLLTHKIKDIKNIHYVDYILNILKNINGIIENKNPEIYINNEDSENILTKFLKSNLLSEKIIGLNLTAIGEKARTWPKEYSIDLIKKLLEKNFIIFLFGTNKDIKYSEYINSKIDNNKLINLIGKTNIKEFIVLLKKCDIFVSVATGGIHIANALNKKIIGLYCPGDEIGWGPYNKKNVEVITKYVNCSPCNQHKMKHCKNNICMKLISPEEVFEKIIYLLN